jgi:hypothetical protein
LGTIKPTTTLGSSRAATAFIATAVQWAVTGDAIVIAENRASQLAAFAAMSALSTEPDGPAIAT